MKILEWLILAIVISSWFALLSSLLVFKIKIRSIIDLDTAAAMSIIFNM